MPEQSPVEITVIIVGTDSRYRQKFLEYKEVSCSHYNEVIKECIEIAKKSYRGDIEEIKIKCSF